MAFLDAFLSDRVSYGFKFGPQYNTLVVPGENGWEYRNRNWLYPRMRGTASYGNFKEAERAEILAAFHACAGRHHCFKFYDWTDASAVNESISPSVGTTDAVQLTKSYTFGGQTQTRLVQATKSTATLKKDGVAFTAYTLDAETGLVTPDEAWAAGTYTWSGPVYVWVRFDSDYNAFSIDEYDASNTDIELVEVRR